MSNEEMVMKIRDGETELLQDLYDANKGLIRHIVKAYAVKVEIEDLMQQAFFSLHKAVMEYEQHDNVRFSSLFTVILKHDTYRYVCNCGQIVRLPDFFYSVIGKYTKFISLYENVHGKKPTDKQICNALRISEENLKLVQKYNRKLLSIDKEYESEDGTHKLGDMIADDNVDVEKEVLDAALRDDLGGLWDELDKILNEMEISVLKALYVENKTLEATGKELGCNLSYIRALRDKTLRKLRLRKNSARLEKYVDPDYIFFCGGYSFFKCHGSVQEYILTENPNSPMYALL